MFHMLTTGFGFVIGFVIICISRLCTVSLSGLSVLCYFLLPFIV